MRTYFKAVVVSLLAIAPASVPAAVIPFDPSRGLVEIEVLIDGKITGRFGLDTGADHLYIDKGFAERNGLNVSSGTPERKVTGIQGTSDAKTINLRSLEIGDLPMIVSVPATVIDIAALDTKGRGHHPDGLIGQNILRRFFVTVDYPERSIELRTDMPRALAGKNYETILFKPVRHLVVVEVVINDTVRVPMILDYCATHTAISPDLASRLGLTGDNRNLTTLPRVKLGRKAESINVSAVTTDLSSFKQSFGVTPIEGILGGTFLADHVITVDYSHSSIYILK